MVCGKNSFEITQIAILQVIQVSVHLIEISHDPYAEIWHTEYQNKKESLTISVMCSITDA